METNLLLEKARRAGRSVLAEMSRALDDYRKREGASAYAIKSRERMIAEFVQAMDTFDDLVLILSDRVAELEGERAQAYARGYRRGREEAATGLRRPSRIEREALRRYTIALDRLRTEGEEIPPSLKQLIDDNHTPQTQSWHS